jgi:hypothetical protein
MLKALLQDPRRRVWLAVATAVVIALAVTHLVVAYSHGGAARTATASELEG